MSKEKMKQWMKEHEVQIKAGVMTCIIGGLLVGSGIAIGYDAGIQGTIPFKSKKARENIRHVLTTGDGIYNVAGLINADSLKIDELGELGKALVDACGAPADSTWSRFICISNNLADK